MQLKWDAHEPGKPEPPYQGLTPITTTIATMRSKVGGNGRWD